MERLSYFHQMTDVPNAQPSPAGAGSGKMHLLQCNCSQAAKTQYNFSRKQKILLQFLYFHFNTTSLCKTSFITINRY